MGILKRMNKEGQIIEWIVDGVDMLETGLASKVLKYSPGEHIYDQEGNKIANIDQMTENRLAEWEAMKWKIQNGEE